MGDHNPGAPLHPVKLGAIPKWEWDLIIAQGRAALIYLALTPARWRSVPGRNPRC